MPAAPDCPLLHPTTQAWFERDIGEPSPVQRAAWPRLIAGEHGLLIAPTGSGKTLAATLPALDQLVTGAWAPGAVRLIYLSPLKALGSDVQRNLIAPLAHLQAAHAQAGDTAVNVAVGIRTGDTSPNERERQLRRPPEILVTTPESLVLMVTSKRWQDLLGGVQAVVLDEIHALAGDRRGALMQWALEQIVRLSGEVQRIACSATVAPIERIAAIAGGFVGAQPRPVAIIEAGARRIPQLVVHPPPDVDLAEAEDRDAFWRVLAPMLAERIERARSTLVFVGSRQLAERLTRFLNEGRDEQLAYAHHGSLAQDLRRAVEARLKAGEIPAVIATASLELGIDVGDCEQVLLVQTPASAAATLQRLGRAGHRLDRVIRGEVFTTHGHDLLAAAGIARMVAEGSVEPVVAPRAPLDVLTQLVVARCLHAPISPATILAECQRTWAWHELDHATLERVINAAAGRADGRRVRELPELIEYGRDPDQPDAIQTTGFGRVLFYANLGTIPDRGLYQLRRADDGRQIAELDEEFVWERKVGDQITVAGARWFISAIKHDHVEVKPAGDSGMAPFWKNEQFDGAWRVAEARAELLASLGGQPRAFAERLAANPGLSPAAAERLAEFLAKQHEVTGAIAHRWQLVCEQCPDPSGALRLLIVHAPWGRRILRPLALALPGIWRERFDGEIAAEATDDCLVCQLPHAIEPPDLLKLFEPTALERHLRGELAASGFFGARFREVAGCALALARRRPNRRLPLWQTRQRAKELLARLARTDDHPLVAETWRTCLADRFDLTGLSERLAELADGRISCHHVFTAGPSPMCADLVYQRVNRLMYADDQPLTPAGTPPALVDGLLRPGDRHPALDPAVVADFLGRVQRTAAGYTPEDAHDLAALVDECILLTADEWQRLLTACRRDGHDPDAWLTSDQRSPAGLLARMVVWQAPDGTPRYCGALHLAAILAVADCTSDEATLTDLTGAPWQPPRVRERDEAKRGDGSTSAISGVEATRARPDALISAVLTTAGPLTTAQLSERLLLPINATEAALQRLHDGCRVVRGPLLAGSDAVVAIDPLLDERLLRAQRRARREQHAPPREPLPISYLPVVLAHRHGLVGAAADQASHTGPGSHSIDDAIDSLLGFPAPAAAWEHELLPARLGHRYHGSDLDELCAATGPLMWLGCGRQRLTIAVADQLDLVRPSAPTSDTAPLPAGSGRLTTSDLLAKQAGDQTGNRPAQDSASLITSLWQAAWAGTITADGFSPVRRGLANTFQAPAAASLGSRGGWQAWRATRSEDSVWHRLPDPEPAHDLLAAAEREEQRARIVLNRYGIVFRELLAHELPALRWAAIVTSLRRLELSGEVIGGRFLTGTSGLQFATPAALTALDAARPEAAPAAMTASAAAAEPHGGSVRHAAWWCSAVDPVAATGLGLAGLEHLPARRSGTWLLWWGANLALTTTAKGAKWQTHLSADHPGWPAVLALFDQILAREQAPPARIRVDLIDDQPAPDHALAELLAGHGWETGPRGFSRRRDPR